MSQHFTREKKTTFLLRFLYWLNKFMPLKTKTKLHFYLDLQWIFTRLAHETAKKYYTDNNFPFKSRATEFLLSEIKPGFHVLDLGCGLGSKSFLMAQKAKSVTGIDNNQHHIETAKSLFQLPNLKFIATDALSFLASGKDQFDVLILSHILEHINNPQALITQYSSYFKWIYIEVPDIESSDLNPYRIDLQSNFRYTDDDHLVEYDRLELIKILESCNLQIIKSEYIFGVQKYWCATAATA